MIYIIVGGSCAGKTSFVVNSFIGDSEVEVVKDIVTISRCGNNILLGDYGRKGTRTKGTDTIGRQDINKIYDEIDKLVLEEPDKNIIMEGCKIVNHNLFDYLIQKGYDAKMYYIHCSQKKSIERNKANNSTVSISTLKAECSKAKNVYQDYKNIFDAEKISSEDITDFSQFKLEPKEKKSKTIKHKDMEIVKVDLKLIKPYENNAKQHPREQIEQIKKSILEFGNNDPIAIDENNTIIEGHGRYYALKELGYDYAECIRLTHLTDEQKKAYILVHNKLTMNSDFDFEILNNELADIINIDMEDFGFFNEEEEFINEMLGNIYTNKIKIPQYEIKGEEPEINDLVDDYKVNVLLQDINNSNVDEEKKEFLRKAVTRLYTFNYKNIAEYYAHQDKEMQKLMEDLALVIIDVDDAIANGYVQLSSTLEEMLDNEN